MKLLRPHPIDVDRKIVEKLGLAGFARLAFEVTNPGDAYSHNWHLDAVAEHLGAVARNEVKNLVINVPPGHMKSLIVSVFWPTFSWLADPTLRYIIASFDQRLTLKQSIAAKSIVQSEWFRERWPHVRQDTERMADTQHWWGVDGGGWRYHTSLKGKLTGNHADIAIVDDPLKPIDVAGGRGAAGTELAYARDWYNTTLPSRFVDQRKARTVVIMQRLAEGDIADIAIEQGATVLCLPAEYDPSHKLVWARDPRVEPGEPLWPERFPSETLDALKRRLGSRAYAAQYQQWPVPADGEVFKKSWLKYYSEGDYNLARSQVLMSFDCTFKDADTSDWVVGQVWAHYKGRMYLLDQVRGRWNVLDTAKQIQALKKRWPTTGRILIEDKANGPAVQQVLKHGPNPTPGVIMVNPLGGKEARANAAAPFIEAGDVLFPQTDFADSLTAEMLAFPAGKHDDQVDALTQAVCYTLGKSTSFLDVGRKLARP